MNIDCNTHSLFVKKLINDTQQGKLTWDHAHHHTEAPDIFDQYVLDKNPSVAILSDTFFTNIKEGFVYLVHQCRINDIEHYDPDKYLSHGIYFISEKSKPKIASDFFSICVQSSLDLYPRDIHVDFDDGPAAGKHKEVQGELYVLQQTILRSRDEPLAFIRAYLARKI